MIKAQETSDILLTAVRPRKIMFGRRKSESENLRAYAAFVIRDQVEYDI